MREGTSWEPGVLAPVPLPPDVDVEGAEARVANGVLTARFPKRTTRPGIRRIPIHI